MTAMLKVKNWQKFQHYKDRCPPWIKLHYEIMTSADWCMLADASKLLAVVCMLIASRNEGCVPNNPKYLKRVAYLENEPDLTPLIECGFLEIMQAHASIMKEPLADASISKQEQANDTTEAEAYRTETEKKEAVAEERVDAPLQQQEFLNGEQWEEGQSATSSNCIPLQSVGKKRQSAVATALPPDWGLPADWGEWAIATRKWDNAKVLKEEEKFALYYHSADCKRPLQRNWQECWQRWCLGDKDVEFQGKKAGAR
jgi:hypothetical protein